MSEEIKEIRESTNPIKLFGLMLPSIPSLLFRLGGTLIRFKSNANKAGKVFHRELRNQGLDKKTADELTNLYLDGSNLVKYISIFR
jgi:hypothetical protein